MGDTMEQILVGSYTTGTESDGIYRLKVEQGMIRDIEVVMFAEDPSYLLPVPGGLYWVNESLGSKEGKVGFARKRLRGGYERIWEVGTKGENPCHLALSPDGSTLAVANYTSGSVAVYDVTGKEPNMLSLLEGRSGSVNPARQEGPHAHFVLFRDNRTLWCSDLGADEVRLIERDGDAWVQADAPVKRFAPGDGPRHLLDCGDHWYAITELSQQLCCFRENGEYRAPVVIDGVEGTGAALRMDDEGLLYCTQRGMDLMTVFQDTGTELQQVGIFATGGMMPRDCLPVGNMVLCACQGSGDVTCLWREGWMWTGSDRVKAPGAVCLALEK